MIKVLSSYIHAGEKKKRKRNNPSLGTGTFTKKKKTYKTNIQPALDCRKEYFQYDGIPGLYSHVLHA